MNKEIILSIHGSYNTSTNGSGYLLKRECNYKNRIKNAMSAWVQCINRKDPSFTCRGLIHSQNLRFGITMKLESNCVI